MTLSRLIKQLQKIEAIGNSRIQVVIDKPSFWDGNGTFSACDVAYVKDTTINICDGDGFTISNKDGTERIRRVVMIQGIYPENP